MIAQIRERVLTLTCRQIDAIGVGACVVALAAGFIVVVKPITVQRQELAALHEELRSAEMAAGQVRSEQQRLNDDLAGVQSRLNAVPVHLEPVEEQNMRIARIVELASDSGITIHESRSGTLHEGLRFSSVPIEVSGSGAYPACAQFLHRVYRELPDVEVVRMELRSDPSDPRAPASFSFCFTWYAAAKSAAS